MARVRVRRPTPQRMPMARATARWRLRCWGKTRSHWPVCLRRKSKRFMEEFSETRFEHRHPNGFAGQLELMETVLAAAALGLTDTGPVGGPIDRGAEAVDLDEAFQQIEIVLVLGAPIRADAALDLAQQMAAQMGDVD